MNKSSPDVAEAEEDVLCGAVGRVLGKDIAGESDLCERRKREFSVCCGGAGEEASEGFLDV